MSKKDQPTKKFVFQVKAFQNTAKIKSIGYILYGEQFKDEEIIVDDPAFDKDMKAVKIMDDVYIRIFKCNIIDSYLQANKKLPVISANVFYHKKFLSGYLMSIYVNFTISTDTKEIKNVNQLLSTELNGKYTTEIWIGEKPEIVEMETFSGYDKCVKRLIEIIKGSEMTELISREIKQRDEDRRKKLGPVVTEKPREATINIAKITESVKNGENIYDVVSKMTKR